MTPETQAAGIGSAEQPAGDGSERGQDMLTVTDSRTGAHLRAADQRRHGARDGPAPDQNRRGRLRPDGLRPGLHEHGLLPQLDHLHRRRRRHPAAPRLPDRAALRALQLPRGRLPDHQRRAAHARAARATGSTRSRSTRSCTRTSRTSCRASATTPTRWACSWPPSARSRPSTRTPTRSTTRHVRRIQIIRLLAEDADAGRVRVPAQHGPALRLPRQRPQLRGQLPGDDVQDDRAQVRARSAPRARARRALHPARRPRTERLHERGALGRLDPGRPLHGGRRRRRRALRPAARRRQRGRAADAHADRQRREHPRLPRGRQGRARSA